MAKKSSGWNLQEMQATLVKDTEQSIEQGFEEIKNEDGGAFAVKPATEQPVPAAKDEAAENTAAAKEAEPTKGVQTYIAVSMYRRLSDIKLTRGETIGNLVAEAVALWLDVQEGKAKVSEVI